MVGTHSWMGCVLAAAIAAGGMGGPSPGGQGDAGVPAAPVDPVDEVPGDVPDDVPADVPADPPVDPWGFRILWKSDPVAWHVLIWGTGEEYLAVGLLRTDSSGHVELTVGPQEAAELGMGHLDVGLFPLGDIVDGDTRRERRAVQRLERFDDSVVLFFDEHLPLDEQTVEAASMSGDAIDDDGDEDGDTSDSHHLTDLSGRGEPQRPSGGGGSGPPPVPPPSTDGGIIDPTVRAEVTAP